MSHTVGAQFHRLQRMLDRRAKHATLPTLSTLQKNGRSPDFFLSLTMIVM